MGANLLCLSQFLNRLQVFTLMFAAVVASIAINYVQETLTPQAAAYKLDFPACPVEVLTGRPHLHGAVLSARVLTCEEEARMLKVEYAAAGKNGYVAGFLK